MSAQDDSGAVAGPGPASAEEQAAALAALPNPVFIMKAVRDADGTVLELRYIFLNEASARLLGQPVELLIGRGLSEVFPPVRELGIFDTYVGAIDSDKPVSFDVPSFRDNGVEGSFSLTVIRFGDGLLVSAVDTTEQRKTERELADSIRKYRLLAENASDVVVLTSPDREITWMSSSVT